MSLAQVVYNMSTDMDFATLWRKDPETALAKKGLKLSREEQEFLTRGLTRRGEDVRKVRLSEISYGSWR